MFVFPCISRQPKQAHTRRPPVVYVCVCVGSATVTVERQRVQTSVSHWKPERMTDQSADCIHGRAGWDGVVVTQCNHTELIGRIPSPVRTPPLSLLQCLSTAYVRR